MARKKEKEQRKKKPQDENIMACPITYWAAVINDLIETHKIMNGKYDINRYLFLKSDSSSRVYSTLWS